MKWDAQSCLSHSLYSWHSLLNVSHDVKAKNTTKCNMGAELGYWCQYSCCPSGDKRCHLLLIRASFLVLFRHNIIITISPLQDKGLSHVLPVDSVLCLLLLPLYSRKLPNLIGSPNSFCPSSPTYLLLESSLWSLITNGYLAVALHALPMPMQGRIQPHTYRKIKTPNSCTQNLH